MQESRFYAYISRMKHIFRWSLMKNSQEESLSVHTLDTAVIAHCLGLLRNRRFGGSCDAQRLVMLAIYHDCSEILTGDMPTPIKYYNPEIKEAYKKVEVIANQKLLAMLPQDLRADYEPLFIHEGEDPELLKLLKAADKISALIKCVEEENSGKGVISGKSDEFIIVEFKGNKDFIGQFVKVKITDAHNWALYGEIINI